MTDQITVTQRKTQSFEWMSANYHSQIVDSYQAYLCECNGEPDPNDPTKIDTSQTALAMPDTWGYVNRSAARITAQLPNIRHRSDNANDSELIGRTQMYQWDRSGMQRGQKKHTRQALLAGWSVKAWSWKTEKFKRRKKVNILDPNTTPDQLAAVIDFHLPKLQQEAPIQSVEQVMQMMADPNVGPGLRQALVKILGSANGLIPVEYDYKGYEGPHSEVLFIGDCYPEPQFQSIQGSNWFIVERRRDRAWLDNAAIAFPELKDGIAKLLEAHPKGTPYRSISGTFHTSGLRDRLMSATGFSYTSGGIGTTNDTGFWTITEMHTTGANGSITYIGDDSRFIGEIVYPYDLDGWVAFTELVLIDNLLCGWGDSTARVLRGLQALHNKSVSQRADLVDAVTNPLIFTSDRNLIENPEQIRRRGRMRLVYARGGSGAINWENNGPAAAAVITSLNDESSMMRMFQVGTGDSNMSMAANVDPAQNRTATGARLSAFNQDVLTKDAVDMFNMALAQDAEMMFRLNRSEFGDAIHIDAGMYNRTYAAKDDPFKDQWVKIEPALFQRDGHITVEVGSTLADDDEAKVQKAQMMFQMFNGHPMVNQQRLLTEVLKPFARTGDVAEFMAPPQPPPPPEDKTRTNISVSVQYIDLPPEAQQLVLQEMAGAKMPPPPPPPGPPPPTGEMPPEPPPEGHPGMNATAAAEGNAPPVMEGGAQF
jgi:hypothetical protein